MDLIPMMLRMSRMMEKRLLDNVFPRDFLIGYVPATRRWDYRPQQGNNGFQLKVDVQQFAPEEISVKMTDNYITVEGKHEEKQDEHGFISRHFVRKYQIPEGLDNEKIESSLSADGVLTIKAPNLALPESKGTERAIPVVQTGKPVKQIQNEKKN